MRLLLCVTAVLMIAGCDAQDDATVTLRFWAMGREGQVVQEMVTVFERENPGIEVDVQQIPWSAAHEKLLTAFVGRSTPDIAQLGNTWVAEFVALRAIEPLDRWIDSSTVVGREHDFPGIWDTNVLGDVTFGVPWYVDTRVLFYRKDLLRQAGYERIPDTWQGWRECLLAMKQNMGADAFPLFLPINEWNVPVILGLQAGSPLLDAAQVRGVFQQEEFRRAFHFYVEFFRDHLAPPVSNNEIANFYQEFARGYLGMFITGPWNLGEFSRRLPAELQDAWATSALPGPEGFPGVSLAGGSSLVLFRGSRHKEAGWKLIEFLSRPEQQLEFHRLSGNLPAREAAWQDSTLRAQETMQAFYDQLHNVVATPKIPEWEQITTRVLERAEQAIRGAASVDSALAGLDRDVGRILEKRRWLLEHDHDVLHGATR